MRASPSDGVRKHACETGQKHKMRPPIFGSPIFFSFAHRAMGPCPIQLVVVTAVRKAVSAATITFTTTSINRFFFISFPPLRLFHFSFFI